MISGLFSDREAPLALQAIGKKEFLSDRAYHSIRTAIIHNELKSGEVLIEEKLAEQLNISRTPIRTALQMLVNDKLAENDARGRIIVSEVVVKDVRDIDQVRAEIEPLSVRLNCMRGLTDAQGKELRSFCRAQSEAAARDDVENFFVSGYRFHNHLAVCSGNHFLANMIERASLTAVRYLMKRPDPERYIDNSGVEHEEILALIILGAEQEAVSKMRNHIQTATSCFNPY
ncbi:MAG: GntR family transcriptional regulator [Oscillospiraceae bacterium]|nr:GntR family transcriptional regulator [Oscillospiraceae bacterium]